MLHEERRRALRAHRRRRVPAVGRARAGGRLGGVRRPALPLAGVGRRCCTACARGRARSTRCTAPTPGTYRAAHPEEGAIFDAAMTDIMRRANAHLLAAYDFGRFGPWSTSAAGRGAFLGAILAAHPGMRGVLFDQPHVVAGGAARRVGERCEVVAGSFFDDGPGGRRRLRAQGGPARLGGRRRAARSCGRCRARDPRPTARCSSSSATSARPTRTPTPSSRTSTCWSAPAGASARARSSPTLLAAGGFALQSATPSAIGLSVFEAHPA